MHIEERLNRHDNSFKSMRSRFFPFLRRLQGKHVQSYSSIKKMNSFNTIHIYFFYVFHIGLRCCKLKTHRISQWGDLGQCPLKMPVLNFDIFFEKLLFAYLSALQYSIIKKGY